LRGFHKGELDQSKLPTLLELKYGSTSDAVSELGDVTAITDSFVGFQKYLYEERVQ
jgi:type I restriction enzyme R subunit